MLRRKDKELELPNETTHARLFKKPKKAKKILEILLTQDELTENTNSNHGNKSIVLQSLKNDRGIFRNARFVFFFRRRLY